MLNPRNRKYLAGERPALNPALDYGSLGLIGVAGVVIITLLLLTTIPRVLDLYDLRTEGEIIEAMVNRRERTEYTDSDGDTHYNHYLTCTYTINKLEKTFTRRAKVGYDTYNAHPEGSLIEVRYDPDNPAQAVLVEDNDTGTEILGMLFLNGLAVVLVGGGIWLRVRHIRRKKALSEGYLIDGEVIESKVHEDSYGNKSLVVVYYFVSPQNGQGIINKKRAKRYDITREGAPRRGTRIQILYASDKIYEVL